MLGQERLTRSRTRIEESCTCPNKGGTMPTGGGKGKKLLPYAKTGVNWGVEELPRN